MRALYKPRIQPATAYIVTSLFKASPGAVRNWVKSRYDLYNVQIEFRYY